MELLLIAVVLHVLCLFQGLLGEAVSSERNGTGLGKTDGEMVEKQSGPQRLGLSQVCSGILGTEEDGKWIAVSLKHLNKKNQRKISSEVCMSLGCGGLYEFKDNGTAPNDTCLTNCNISNSAVHNCMMTALGDCTKIMEVVCEFQVVQLVGGTDSCEGRVELRRNEQWGSVCDDDWSLRGGHVVCAQLDCGNAVRVTGEADGFGPGKGLIHISKLNCTGTESNLWQCRAQKDEDTNYCGHKEDAGVVCSGSASLSVPSINTTQPINLNWTTESGADIIVDVGSDSSSRGLSIPVIGCIILSIGLVLVLFSNAAVCTHYKRRKACVIHENPHDSYAAIEGQMTEETDNNVNSQTVNSPTVNSQTVNSQTAVQEPLSTVAPQARRPSDHDSSDTSSCSDYERYYNSYVMTYPTLNTIGTPVDALVVDECNHTPESQEEFHKGGNALQNVTNCDADADAESSSSEECYQNPETEREALLNSVTQSHPEQSQPIPPLHNTNNQLTIPQSSQGTSDWTDTDSTFSSECYENTGTEAEAVAMTSEECYKNPETEREALLNSVTQSHPEQSQPIPPLHNTNNQLTIPQSSQGASDWTDTDSTSSGECYENTGTEAEAFVMTMTERPSLPEQIPVIPQTQQTEIIRPAAPSHLDQDNSSTSSEEAYENVPEIDQNYIGVNEQQGQTSSSDSDYDDVANW